MQEKAIDSQFSNAPNVAGWGDSEPRREELERLFHQYPEVPREVILKNDLLRLGHWFTESALEQAAKVSQLKSYRLFSHDLISMSDMKGKEFTRFPEWIVPHGGEYDLRPVVVQMRADPRSPYCVDLVDGSLKLLADGVPICEVSYPQRMQYTLKTLPDGTPYNEIIAYGFFVTVFRYCQYWGPDEECRFCDINSNARQMKESRAFTFNAPVKPVEAVVEVARAIEEEMAEEVGFPIPLRLIVTGGTITGKLRGKDEDEFYMDYVSALKWGGRRRYITLQTNAKDKETMKSYWAAGLDCQEANLEVWDKGLFEWMNPGKARRIGWEQWVQWLIDAVDVLGEGNVRPNFVGGVEMAKPHGFKTVKEAVQSTRVGLETLMRYGVFPRITTWSREPGAFLVQNYEQPPVPLEYYASVMREYYELWGKYGLPLPPCGNHGHPHERFMGNSNGTYDDVFLLNAVPDYRERAHRTIAQGQKRMVTRWQRLS
jgi:hypothetical protein